MDGLGGAPCSNYVFYAYESYFSKPVKLMPVLVITDTTLAFFYSIYVHSALP
jgi:hypothetical protein